MAKTTTPEAELLECLQHGEAICRRCYEQEREPTFDELLFLKTRCGWDDRKISAEKRRMTNVVRFQQIAGTTEAREAMANELQAAKSVLDEQGPILRAEIEEREAKLRAMEADVTKATRRSEEMADAVNKLRELLPPALSAEYNSKRNALFDSVRRDLFDIESEIRHIEVARDINPNTPEGIEAIALRGRMEGRPFAAPHPSRLGYVVTPAWQEYVSAKVARLPDLIAERDELQQLFDKEMAELNGLLNHYVR